MSLFENFDFGDLPMDVVEKIKGHADKAHDTAMEGAKLGFKSKMDAMDAKVKAAEQRASAFDGVEPDEIGVLRGIRDKSKETAAMLDDLKSKYSEKERLLQQKANELERLDTRQKLSYSLQEYESSGGLPVQKGAQDDVIRMLEERMKKDGENRYFTKPDGTPFVTEGGYGGAKEYISTVLRTEKPFLFQQPSGGGAPGSNSTSGSAKTIPRASFAKLSPAEKMDAMKSGAKVID